MTTPQTEETTFGALAVGDMFYFWTAGMAWNSPLRASALHVKQAEQEGDLGPINAQELHGPYRTYLRDDVAVVKVPR